MLWHHAGNRVLLGSLFKAAVNPCELWSVENGFQLRVFGTKRAVIQVGRIVYVPSVAGGVYLNVQHPLGNYPALACARNASVLHSMLQVKEHARLITRIAVIDEHSATPQQVTMAFERQINCSIKQRMAGT